MPIKKWLARGLRSWLAAAALLVAGAAAAEVCNLKIVTDASPDYSDLPSLLHSATAKWASPEEKCWALFYWNHIARRQTAPMILHGMEVTDPIRQFNDYGYTMCSTISGVNCALWNNLGLPVKFWDITLHTVSEVSYGGRWHMYDNSMTALYTLCDGVTIAGVEDIGREGACAASGGVSERGHVAKYHCLYSTGPKGFLTGADTQRSLDEEAHCFNPNGLKYRNYYFNWDYGHRYILDLRENESYTRYYHRQGKTPAFYVPNEGKDPDDRYAIRGNGIWRFKPSLSAADYLKHIHSATNVTAGPAGLHPATAGQPAEVVFKVQAANVISSQIIRASVMRASREDTASIAVSADNGLHWKEVWQDGATGDTTADADLLDEVSGAYETLIRINLQAKQLPADASLRGLDVQTTTMLNAKTQPKLNLGRNTVFIGAGDSTESIVLWPFSDLSKVASNNLAPVRPGGRGGSTAPPTQFQVWGSQGPALAKAPTGWTEVAPASEGLPTLNPTEDEKRRGFMVFALDPMAPAECGTAPSAGMRTESVRCFAARGQYEPLTFGLWSLEDLGHVTVRVDQLRSEDGAMIPADHVEVRVARPVREIVDAKARAWRWRPFLLERRAEVLVAAGTAAQVWLTVKAPEEATPGIYAGIVRVSAAGRPEASVKLTLRVLPFTLPPAPIEMALYTPKVPPDDALFEKELLDLREHGLNAMEPALTAEVASRDQVFGADDVAAIRADCARRMRLFEKIFGKPCFPATLEVGHQIAFYWVPAQAWFAFWPHSPKIDDEMMWATAVVCQAAKEAGWKSLRAFALDEAGAHNLLDQAVYYYGLLKRRAPDLPTTTDIGGGIAMGYDEIGRLSPVVDHLWSNRLTPDLARALLDRGKPWGVYNGTGPTPAGARYFFGFYGWHTAAQSIAQWAYFFSDDIFGGNGLRAEDDGFVYHATDGPLPSFMTEAVRAGIDDYRYLALLDGLIAAARSSSNAATRTAADGAARDLAAICGQMQWTFQAIGYNDRTPPPNPATLRKWRGIVADQILRLRGLLPDVERVPSARMARSPFDMPWAQADAKPLVYGREMLPASDFERDAGPWRVEAWKGKAAGWLDTAEHHGGTRSMRVDVPVESGDAAITVLVWPQWGGGGLNLALEGGKTYEFAAWVKLKDRLTPLELRVNVPSTAVRSTRAGQESVQPDGWRRIWMRFETTGPSQPNYIAVWLPGIGTMWVDDLSLREVVPPAAGQSLHPAPL